MRIKVLIPDGTQPPRSFRKTTEIRIACAQLRDAQMRLRRNGANKAADYVARARKSADGALRHAQRMEGAQ